MEQSHLIFYTNNSKVTVSIMNLNIVDTNAQGSITVYRRRIG